MRSRAERRISPSPLAWVAAACGAIFLAFSAGVVLGSRKGIPFVDKVETWSIGVYQGTSPLELAPPGDVDDPILTATDVTDVDAVFVADPFAVAQGTGFDLFFEVLNRATGQGDIAYATSPDGRTWDYQKVVLDEAFHLSYPQVFQWGGDYYLIPESEEDLSVRLYRASHFPDQWEFAGRLLEGRHFLDPTILRYEGKWWLFVTFLGNDVLALYQADSLQGPWTEHPQSPVVRGNSQIARPGGRVLEADGRLFRFAQDDSRGYGGQLFAFEITTLTPEEYQERPALESPVLAATGSGWNATGMHQLDLHPFRDGWIGFVDGKSMRIRVGWPF